MMRFAGKSIIVTGAGSGIGRAAAILFAAEGGRVIVADKTEGADETARLIAEAGGTAKAIRMDAGSEADVIATIELAVAEFGGLDVVFANAG
ncbi:SDR family NAD(P)-dependent oxidoreductase, partial [Sphingomonas sp.]|uniref:SDR family NAD(P)-dependent oxidoreductase n=1 Tax=Sphingomonas sp. TaxID=28214 RepID=UPI0031E25C8F